VDPFRDDQDVGLRTMDWGSSCGFLPGLIGHLGQGGRFVVPAAEPTRFSAIGGGAEWLAVAPTEFRRLAARERAPPRPQVAAAGLHQRHRGCVMRFLAAFSPVTVRLETPAFASSPNHPPPIPPDTIAYRTQLATAGIVLLRPLSSRRTMLHRESSQGPLSFTKEEPVMKTRMWTIAVVTALASALGSTAISAQDKYTVKVPGGLAFSEFRGYEDWRVVSISHNGDLLAVILANPVMIDAYRAGVPGNGKPFPDGSKMAKIHWNPKKMETFPSGTVPATLHDVDFMVKDSKRFADTGGWGWAVFKYEAASGTFTPGTSADVPPQGTTPSVDSRATRS